MSARVPGCGARWAEWDLSCEIELGHPGAHLSFSGAGGKIGAWGGAIDHMERVAETGPADRPDEANGDAGPVS